MLPEECARPRSSGRSCRAELSAIGATSIRSSRRSRSDSASGVGWGIGREQRRAVAVEALASSTWRRRPTRGGGRLRAGRAGRTASGCGPQGPTSSCRRCRRRPGRCRFVEVLGQGDVGAVARRLRAVPRPWPSSGTGSPRGCCASTISRATGSSSMWQPAGRNGNPCSTCSFDVLAGAAEQCPEASVEAELLAVVADEVEHGAGGLAGRCRRPRPSCWRNSVGLSVGRSMSSVSTAGTSTPSLNRSTENTTRTRPAARSLERLPPARLVGLSPQIAVDAMPASLNCAGHEAGVLDADAEAERPHGARSSTRAATPPRLGGPRRRRPCRGSLRPSTS